MVKRPKILFVHNGPTEFVRLDLAALRESFEVTERFEWSRVVNPFTLWREVKHHDLVFGWFASWHTFLPVQFAKTLGKPSVLVIGGYDVANMPEIDYGHQRGGLKKWTSRRTMRMATRLVTNSDYSRAEIARNIGMTNGRVLRIFHGVPDRQGALPRQKERSVLTVGNVDRANLRRKGHEPFVRAAALLPDVKFVLVGDWKDDAVNYLRSFATPNVEFTGRVSDEALLDYYRSAAIYVQPSLHEGFGMSVAEAMLAGCFPVITEAGALPEVTGDCGRRVARPDPELIAEAVRTALTAPDELRGAVRDRILQNFPMTSRSAQLREVVEQLVNSH
jgi:glycosyltransferase involved in cell wall biosynthesis